MMKSFFSLQPSVRLAAWVGLVVALSGCGDSAPARFHLNMVSMTSNNLTKSQQEDIATVLEAMFGTPDDPRSLAEMGLDGRKIRMAAGPVWSDESGSNRGLYRRHCAHCHGITGDGAGPTASFLNPYPRDYRRGLFKFKSTERAARPTTGDLRRILAEGIPGTAMPSFRLLPSDERDALVEYVKYLAIRGEMEIQLIGYVAFELGEEDRLVDEDPNALGHFIFTPGPAVLINDLLSDVVKDWAEADSKVIHPDQQFAPTPGRSADEIAASAAKGQALFFSADKGNCFSCHGPGALGDGVTNDYDDWNKVISEFAVANKEIDPRTLGALRARNARPRNLRMDIYRGGGRPVDLYRRLHAGINGTPMPAVGKTTPDAEVGLTPEEIWQLVDYVRSLPFEPISQPPQLPSSIDF